MKNIIYNNIIVEPSGELTPSIRISPFSNQNIYSRNNDEDKNVKEYFNNRFRYYTFTTKGRSAIALALSLLKLESNDVITILTTSNNFYISSCATREIEKVCKWNRHITPSTKVIFVNHEFGYTYPHLSRLKELNLPIIEDCAHSFFTQNNDIGTIGDYVIYSLPKAFPIQLGGILKVKRDIALPRNSELEKYICGHLNNYIPLIDSIRAKRIDNFHFLTKELAPLGIIPYFNTNIQNDIPGTFLFKWHKNINYDQLKVFMQTNGVESSVFYGENAFFIPIHQGLDINEMSYMCELLKYFYDHD